MNRTLGSVGTTGVTKGKEKKNEVKEFNRIKFCFHAFEKMGCIRQLGHRPEFRFEGMGVLTKSEMLVG